MLGFRRGLWGMVRGSLRMSDWGFPQETYSLRLLHETLTIGPWPCNRRHSARPETGNAIRSCRGRPELTLTHKAAAELPPILRRGRVNVIPGSRDRHPRFPGRIPFSSLEYRNRRQGEAALLLNAGIAQGKKSERLELVSAFALVWPRCDLLSGHLRQATIPVMT